MDQLSVDKYVRKLTNVVRERFLSTGSMFQQEHMRFVNLLAATGGGGYGGSSRSPKAIMEHKVTQCLIAVNGISRYSDSGTNKSPQHLDKSLANTRRFSSGW